MYFSLSSFSIKIFYIIFFEKKIILEIIISLVCLNIFLLWSSRERIPKYWTSRSFSCCRQLNWFPRWAYVYELTCENELLNPTGSLYYHRAPFVRKIRRYDVGNSDGKFRNAAKVWANSINPTITEAATITRWQNHLRNTLGRSCRNVTHRRHAVHMHNMALWRAQILKYNLPHREQFGLYYPLVYSDHSPSEIVFYGFCCSHCVSYVRNAVLFSFIFHAYHRIKRPRAISTIDVTFFMRKHPPNLQRSPI